MSVENPHKIDTSKLDAIIESYGCKKSNLIAILPKSSGSIQISS